VGTGIVRVCDAAVLVLRETGNPAVMWGDCGLLDQIHVRAGLKDSRWVEVRHAQVLNALTRQPGELIAGKTMAWVSGCGDRRVRIFWLPGNEPKR
jgi:hypothetical protein